MSVLLHLGDPNSNLIMATVAALCAVSVIFVVVVVGFFLKSKLNKGKFAK